MRILVKNSSLAVSISLTVLKLCGFWASEKLSRAEKLLYNIYGFLSFIFFLGIFLIIQIVDLYIIWGNLPLMTSDAYLLFTNLAQVAKLFNLLMKKRQIQKIIEEADEELRRQDSPEGKVIVKSCGRETFVQQVVFECITVVTLLGWSAGTDPNELPVRGRYPYDTSKSPAKELTYWHQVLALQVAALLNVVKDSLVTSLLAQCRCRLRLLGLSLRTLDKGIKFTSVHPLTPAEERLVSKRLRSCVRRHQATLAAAEQLQLCFSAPTFAQLMVTAVIICVTAFQLASQIGNVVRLVAMGTYLLNMMYQVFIYCYQGNQLAEESTALAGAAYCSPWYRCSPALRRSVLLVMTRCRRAATITAGGFTTLSLASFMAIIKASYSFFTVLQQVEEKP